MQTFPPPVQRLQVPDEQVEQGLGEPLPAGGGPDLQLTDDVSTGGESARDVHAANPLQAVTWGVPVQGRSATEGVTWGDTGTGPVSYRG